MTIRIDYWAPAEGTTLGEFLEYVSVRTNNSHLAALSDSAYEDGLPWIRDRIESAGHGAPAANEVVVITLVADQ